MSDVMLFGILKMPYELAMSTELSRRQFYDRVQELVARFETEQQAHEEIERAMSQVWQDVPGAVNFGVDPKPAQQQYQSTADKCELTPVPAKGGLLPAQIDPSAGTQVSKVWWSGDKLMAQPIPLEKLYKEPEQPAQQQEPHIGWLARNSQGKLHLMTDLQIDSSSEKYERLHKLYTSPQPKPWVGLTDEEKSDLWCESTGRDCVNEDTHVFADAIEAKLREKNNG